MRRRALVGLALPALIGAIVAVRAAAPSRGAAGDPGGATAGSTGAVAASSSSDAKTNGDDGATGHHDRTDTTGDDGATGHHGAGGTIGGDAATGTDRTTGDDSATAHVVETGPSGVRIALDAPISVRFDRAPPAGLTITTEPPAEGKLAFPTPTTATFTPARWADGKPYKVRVQGPGVQTATFEFRTLFPPPERVEPGLGQRITLTFDDGADRPAQVTALLDYLEKEQIQALFFPIGRWAEAHPKLVERMIHDGHRVCNHTYSHQNLRVPQLSEEEIRTEITRGASDGKCRLFRPPLKAFDPRVERVVASLGLTLYLWDVDSRDWEGATTEDIVNLVLAKAHPGAVVLFHMHSQASLDALPQIVPRLRRAGYVLRDPEDAGAP